MGKGTRSARGTRNIPILVPRPRKKNQTKGESLLNTGQRRNTAGDRRGGEKERWKEKISGEGVRNGPQGELILSRPVAQKKEVLWERRSEMQRGDRLGTEVEKESPLVSSKKNCCTNKNGKYKKRVW